MRVEDAESGWLGCRAGNEDQQRQQAANMAMEHGFSMGKAARGVQCGGAVYTVQFTVWQQPRWPSREQW
jgi:hypothetical protein